METETRIATILKKEEIKIDKNQTIKCAKNCHHLTVKFNREPYCDLYNTYIVKLNRYQMCINDFGD